MSAMPLPVSLDTDLSTGGRLVSVDGRVLPFRGASLHVDCKGGLARVRLRQTFDNPTDDVLQVTYQLPLPTDAAVAGYAFELADRRIDGVVDRREAARERFEEALVQGRTAALLEEERSSLFTQSLGNVPPNSQVVCELQLDQRLTWRPDGSWEWRFPTVVAPRFMGQPGRVPDAATVSVDVAQDAPSPRVQLQVAIRDALTGAVNSPSHTVHAVPSGDQLDVGLAAEDGAALDRDIVLRWPVAAPQVGASLDLARATADRTIGADTHALLTIVPPAPSTRATAVPRDLVVLLDTSGSMGGQPLAQAKAVTLALVDSLGPADSLQLIEFSTRPRAWRGDAAPATTANLDDARRWIQALRAGGGTQMRDGIMAALATLRAEAQRQIVLITDGLIGFEREIIDAIAADLPRGSRVHSLGIGSSVNRTLTGGVARAGGGVEAIVGIEESPDQAAALLLARTASPLLVDLELGGSALVQAVCHRAPDLYAGAPGRVALRLRPEGGQLTVRGQTADGPWQTALTVPALAHGSGSDAVLTLVGRERVEELELTAARGSESVDSAIEQVGLDYQIATRRTSWIAISQHRTVDPTAPSRRETVPQALPHGLTVQGLGLRAPAAPILLAHDGAASATYGSSAPQGMPAPKKLRARANRAPVMETMRPGGVADRDDAELDADVDAMFAPASPPPPRAQPAGPTGAPAVEHLRGRLKLAKGGRVVIEIQLDRAFTWAHPRRIEVLLGDGRRVVARLVADQTTRAGRHRAGHSLRLVLEDTALAPPVDIRTLYLDGPGGPVQVDL